MTVLVVNNVSFLAINGVSYIINNRKLNYQETKYLKFGLKDPFIKRQRQYVGVLLSIFFLLPYRNISNFCEITFESSFKLSSNLIE